MTNKVIVHGTKPGTLLGVLFIALKLCGVISWSWWWVTAPFWLPICILGVLFLLVCSLAVLKSCWSTS